MLQRDSQIQAITGDIAPPADFADDRARLFEIRYRFPALPEILQRQAAIHPGERDTHMLTESRENRFGSLTFADRQLALP